MGAGLSWPVVAEESEFFVSRPLLSLVVEAAAAVVRRL